MPPAADTDTWRHAEAQRRETLCRAANALTGSGLSQNETARQLDEDPASLSRYRRAYAAGGYAALLPGVSTGRRSVRDQLAAVAGEEAVAAVERAVQGAAIDMDGSDGAAWRTIARKPGTPAALKEYFAKVEDRHASKHNIARSLRRATRVTPMMRLAHRGPRALSLQGAWTPRHCDILPGDIFGPDDTTPIWGYYAEVEKCEKYPTGYKVGQGQFLPMLDVASQAVVSYALILRETSSYRASDVWRLIGFTHRTVGVPRLGYQMERGSWEAGLVRGVDVTVGEGDFAHVRRVGGLRMLPANCLPYHVDKMDGAAFSTLQTFTSYLPKSKSIEGAFHRLQKFEGTLWGSLGRDQMRRPMEKTKKIYEACKRGAASPPLHFLSLSEINRKLAALMADYHAEPIQGEVFRGRPLGVFEKGIAEHGELKAPPVEQGFLYRSDWSVVKIQRGLARIRRQNHELGRSVSFWYESPELFARLDGKQALIYFDRDAFEQPADVLSVEGEWLGQAHYLQPPGMFLDGDLSGHEERKASRDAVSAIYQSLLPHIPSRQLPAEIAARREAARVTSANVDNGRGQSAWVDAPTGGGTRFVAPEDSTRRHSAAATAPTRRSVCPVRSDADLSDEITRLERANAAELGIYDLAET